MNAPSGSIISLYDLHQQLKDVIRNSFTEPLWVVAETGEIKVNMSGHCYLELVQKELEGDNLVAKARATIWAFTYRILKPYFESVTGEALREGMKVLIRAVPEFHELYGYSLNILDIDPSYTMGDLARQKAETLKKLEQQGVLNMNRELEMPLVPQKIAVISSDTAAGYRDFMDQLHNNPYGYKFYTKLFPAIMQGNEAEKSVIAALERVFRHDDDYDVVTIIRGGGAQSDLSCFNSYRLAYHITQFSLPVISGIGHEKDETITDIVAHTRLKTPTAVADFLIEQVYRFEQQLEYLHDRFSEQVTRLTEKHAIRLKLLRSSIQHAVRHEILKQIHMLEMIAARQKDLSLQFLSERKRKVNKIGSALAYTAGIFLRAERLKIEGYGFHLAAASRKMVKDQNHLLLRLETTGKFLDPMNVLHRGYSITYRNGAIIKDAQQVATGDELKTILAKGRIRSKVM